MNRPLNDSNNGDLKQEVEALRNRVEALESGRARSKVAGRVTRWRRLAAKPALALTAVMTAVLVLGVLSAQNKQDPLFIDPNGNVNIGSARFSKIGVNQAPQSGQTMIITANGDDIPFNVTDKSNTVPWLTVSKDGQVLMKGKGAIINANGTDVPLNVTDKTNSVNWLTVLKDGQVLMNGGNVGVGTQSVLPKLQVTGSTWLSNGTGDSWFPYTDGDSYVSGTNLIFRSNGNNERMRITKDGYVGIGTPTPTPGAKLDVNGDVRIQGKVTSRGRYQRDDEAETTYEIPPPYHLSLTAAKYAGRTKTIPQDVLVGLCGGPSGCEVRLAMTRWDSDNLTEAASRTVLFYYSANDGHWRTSSDAVGVDGNGATEHALVIWSICYLTDGTYSNYQNQGDKEKGMQLLVWNGEKGNSNNPGRTCELTITK